MNRTLLASLSVLLLVGACSDDGEDAATTTTAASVTTVAPPTGIAASVFESWAADGDMAGVRAGADEAVADVLQRWEPGDAAWDGPACEGAAGSTYCSWTSSDATLVLRVGTEAGRVVEARLAAPPDGVAVWPVTTQEQAVNTQQEVDGGSSPWQLEPETVATFYAENVLGLTGVDLEQELDDDPLVLRVTDADGLALVLTMTQPARTGEGGIWAIRDARAAGG